MICLLLVCIEKFNRSKTTPTQNKTNLEVARNDLDPESVIVDAPFEQRSTQNESTGTSALAQSENLANPESDDIPTFDEALDMEVVTVGSPQNDIRRRVSSRLSLSSDELPDYENYESHPAISGIEKF